MSELLAYTSKVSGSSFGTQTDSSNFLKHHKPYLVENEVLFNSSSDFSSGINESNVVEISLFSFQRINEAKIASSHLRYPHPTNTVVYNSWLVARWIAQYELSPTFVNPTFDGAIMLEYHLTNGTYIMLEFFDDGEIVCLLKQNETRDTFSFNNHDELKEIILPVLHNGGM